TVDTKTEMIDLLATLDHAFTDNAVAPLYAVNGFAGLDDLARPLVAGRHRVIDRDDVLAAIEFVVGMTDSDRPHAYKHFIARDIRLRQILDLKFAGFVDHQCLHVRSPHKCAATMTS